MKNKRNWVTRGTRGKGKQRNMGHRSNRATKGWVKRGAGHKGNKRRRGTRRTGEKGRTGEERDG